MATRKKAARKSAKKPAPRAAHSHLGSHVNPPTAETIIKMLSRYPDAHRARVMVTRFVHPTAGEVGAIAPQETSVAHLRALLSQFAGCRAEGFELHTEHPVTP